MLPVTYAEVGATGGALPAGYRHTRVERVIGHGRAAFDRATSRLLAGDVQRGSGAEVEFSALPLAVGVSVRMRLRLGPLVVRAPCVVVWASRSPERSGFAYGTLPGHPERGEERFELHLARTGEVVFRITAFSAPGRWFTRLGAPLGRIVQRRMTARYLTALDAPPAAGSGQGPGVDAGAAVRAPAWERHDLWARAESLRGVQALRRSAVVVGVVMPLALLVLVGAGVAAFGLAYPWLLLPVVVAPGARVAQAVLEARASRITRNAVARWIAAGDGEPGPYRGRVPTRPVS